ncbi:DNA-N1-methyladenine dioxygenase [Shewanella denitrificans OS217]|uniref:DNA-N1-methyladenine dioxygenase n=1 Tax=Shewanella denitrificans (strain OS217 / ATCC BAA-1090 / DSM 15013) TaxID=318161 RepID=Q12QK9_SHEDO|nr:alpha-ketoglutarate-dependent dioxygenase AlkB [Shewanella denitrificans]ABE54267.1 DNA-N1-methyladenine dioxygenase [Shewanella denitrificans OS217]
MSSIHAKESQTADANSAGANPASLRQDGSLQQVSFDFIERHNNAHGSGAKGADLGERCEHKVRKSPPVTWLTGFLSVQEQQALLDDAKSYPFERPQIEVYGKLHPIPRQQVWFADEDCGYRYASLFISPTPWPALLMQLRQRLQAELGLVFNGVLVNFYADGQDTVGWHSDDEAEIRKPSSIASISIGATRDFQIRHKRSQETFTLPLVSGDLLIMQPGMQQTWQHAVPRRAKVKAPRINLTFRELVPQRDNHLI